MTVEIRKLRPPDIDAVVELSLRAWSPVEASMERAMGTAIYRHIWPDWRVSQARAVREVCTDPEYAVWVAERDGDVAGFAAVVLRGEDHPEPNSGEVEMIAVDPVHQRLGLADALIVTAVDYIRTAGCSMAVIATGGDPGHGPARAAYAKAGFTGFPQVRFYKMLPP